LDIVGVPLSWIDSMLLPPGNPVTDIPLSGRLMVPTNWLVWTVSPLCDIVVTTMLPFGNVLVLTDSLDSPFPPPFESVETTILLLDSVEALPVGAD